MGSLGTDGNEAQYSDVEDHNDKDDEIVLGKKETCPRVMPVIVFSGLTPQDKTVYSEIVKRLGGTVLESQKFTDECTHLVIGTVNRNEKMLASIASGKWVLHKSYVMASEEAGCFVNEEDHEWGNEGMAEELGKLSAQNQKLAKACKRWRINVQNMNQEKPGSGGAFAGWIVLLCTDKNKATCFQRLLEAGGANVLSIQPPFTGPMNATHAFLELNKIDMPLTDLNAILSSKATCLRPEYIAAHLTDSPPISVEDYIPAEIGGVKKRKSTAMDLKSKKAKR